MQVQIGLVGRRADLAVEVASLAMCAGAVVHPIGGVGADGRGSAGDEADLVLVDVDALDVDVVGGAGASVAAVICRTGEVPRAQDLADDLGCAHVVELPLGAEWLEAQLAPSPGSGLVGVLGAVGGVGATTTAIACSVGAGPDCLLVDADPLSPGLDLVLGIAEGNGVRWAQIPDSPAPLDPDSLRSALPRVAGVSVVTGPDSVGVPALEPGPTGGQLAGVLGVGRMQFRRTVIDLGRGAARASLLSPGDGAVLVVPATLAGVVAGRRALERLPVERCLVLVRPSRWLAQADVAEQLGVTDVLAIPDLRRAAELSDCGDLLSGRTGRALRELGEQVWEWIG